MRKLRGLWKIIFGRTTMLVVLMAIQFVVLFGGFAILDSQMLSINYIISILAVIILMYLINTNQNSSFKLMWIIFILVVPVVGVTFYIYTRLQPGTKFISRRIEELMVEEDEYLRPDNETLRKISAESNKEIGLFRYLYEKGKYPVYNDASVRYFPSGEDKYRELVHQLETAREFIFLEYFIIDRGEMWDTVLEILKRKVREGVEVRLIYDGTCTLSLLPKNYPQKIRKCLG